MTSPTHITGPELQEIKQRIAQLDQKGELCFGFSQETAEGVWQIWKSYPLIRSEITAEECEHVHTLQQTVPRCIAEIERLRAALQRIYDDGVPYAWPIAAEALGITPPRMS